MLVAYAIENLLKGAAVRLEAATLLAEVESTRVLPSSLKTHDLWHLAASVGFLPQGEEEDLLRRLTRCSVWGGRYPVPVRFDKAEGERYSDGTFHRTDFHCSGDLEDIDDLIGRLRAHLGR